MADSVKVIVKDNQEQVSLWIGTNTGQWVDVASDTIEYAGNVIIGDELEVYGGAIVHGFLQVDGDVYIADEMQVDGGVRSTFYNKIGGLPTEYLMADGSTSSFVSNGEYTDNADALAGGLTIGDVYRTGDLMKIVH